MRVAGVPLERGNSRGIGSEAEFHGAHPCEGAAVQQLGVDQAEEKASVVAAPKEGIIHLERCIASGEIDGDGLVVPEDLAVAEFEAINGKSKKLLDGSFASCNSGLAPWKISSASGIKSDVNYGLLEDEFVKTELGTHQRDYLQTRHDAVNVG